MSDQHGIGNLLQGLSCTLVEKSEYLWHLRFGDDLGLNIECPWRLLLDGSIRFGDGDHEQQFGLATPVDGTQIAREILADSPIAATEVRAGTSDLVLIFANGARLDVFNSSGGYEGWTLTSREPVGFEAVAMGGGRLVISENGATRSKCGLGTRLIGPPA